MAAGANRPALARPGPDPMVGYYGPDMPHYPHAEEVPAGPASRVGGATVRMSFFATEDDPAKVARFYGSFWLQRRFFVRHDVTHLGGVISAWDAQRGLMYQVLLSARGHGTAVFPSVTTSPLRAAETRRDAPLVPLFPESRTLVTFGSDEKDKRARVHLSVNEGGLEANLAHYSRELRAAGYAPEAAKVPRLGPGRHLLLYRKPGSEVTVNLTAQGKRRVRVHIAEVGS
jgi:hypothetical protein